MFCVVGTLSIIIDDQVTTDEQFFRFQKFGFKRNGALKINIQYEVCERT